MGSAARPPRRPAAARRRPGAAAPTSMARVPDARRPRCAPAGRDPHGRVPLVDQRGPVDHVTGPQVAPSKHRHPASPAAPIDPHPPLAGRGGRAVPARTPARPSAGDRRLHRRGHTDGPQGEQLDRRAEHHRSGAVAADVLLPEALDRAATAPASIRSPADGDGELPDLRRNRRSASKCTRALAGSTPSASRS